MNTIIDQARDDERTVLAARTIEKAFSLYKEKLGRYPPEDAEPTPEQLTGVWTLVENKEPPFADFAIFG
eukprot:6054138-Amphidinium_carterae.1